jgi:hypothetical protein
LSSEVPGLPFRGPVGGRIQPTTPSCMLDPGCIHQTLLPLTKPRSLWCCASLLQISLPSVKTSGDLMWTLTKNIPSCLAETFPALCCVPQLLEPYCRFPYPPLTVWAQRLYNYYFRKALLNPTTQP